MEEPAQQFSFDEAPMLIPFIDEDRRVKEALTELRKGYDQEPAYIFT